MALDCVINHTKDNYNEENYEIGRGSIRLTFDDNKTWDFFENGDWVQKGDITGRGTWVCDGLQNYKITNTLGEVFSSKIKKWNATPTTDPNFYCIANSDRNLNSPEKIIRGANSYTRIFKADGTWIFNKDKSWIGRFKEDTPSETFTRTGTWKCIGNNSYEVVIGKYYPQRYTPEENEWVELFDSTFECVRFWYANNEKPVREDSEKLVRVLSTGIIRYFYKSYQFVDMKTVDGKSVAVDKGTWECDGDSDFKLKSKISGVYSSKTNEWIDAPTTPEQNEKPTYDESKFPLRLRSQGPEVVQLQNYLNKQIPMDPLVVNGLFDMKTQNKLKQLQKSLNLTK
jgi:hypothetical protein